ncbi:MAG: hypothetical protein ACE366_00375 [Bradymonadia bacterium]
MVDNLAGEEIMPYGNRYLEALESRGEARGQAMTRIEMTMKVIRRFFPDEAESARSWVEQATPEMIDGMIDRLVDARTLAELLGQLP